MLLIGILVSLLFAACEKSPGGGRTEANPQYGTVKTTAPIATELGAPSTGQPNVPPPPVAAPAATGRAR